MAPSRRRRSGGGASPPALRGAETRLCAGRPRLSASTPPAGAPALLLPPPVFLSPTFRSIWEDSADVVLSLLLFVIQIREESNVLEKWF